MGYFRNSLAVAAVSTMFVLAVGCNVDRVLPEPRQVHGPTVDDSGPVHHREAPADIVVVDAQEVDLVETVLANRLAYHQSLEQLREFYRSRGYAAKESWATFELDGARKVKQFRYVMDSEVPAASLRAEQFIPEADALYDEAHGLMRKGGHGVPVVYSRKVMVEAAAKFREMIERFPTSDKIDDAAFFLGEIHKEYLPNQEGLAVAWYERAWQWDQNTPHPAKFHAALVYDFRLNSRDRALELYQQVLNEDSDLGRINRRYAMRRAEELSRANRTVQAQLP